MRQHTFARPMLTLLLAASFQSHAQAPAASAQTAAPQAIDPVLTKPPAQLTAEQIAAMQQKLADWPQLARYREANAALPPAGLDRVVFFGDSITDAWSNRDYHVFFPGKPYLNRGIGGQTTQQMLARFQQDVIALHPAAVVLLAGINDIAGNTGLESLDTIEDDFRSMVTLAEAAHIRVILASVLPASDFPWRRGLDPGTKVRVLNTWLRQYAATHGCVYLDYYDALVGPDGGMRPGLSKDNVHPTPAGYEIMAPLAQAAIDQALAKPAP